MGRKETYALTVRGSTVILNKDEYVVAAELLDILEEGGTHGEVFAAACEAFGISEDARVHAVNSLDGGCMDPGPGLMGSCRRCSTQELEARTGQ